MKKTSILLTFALLIISSFTTYGQQTPPPGAGDKDLRDTDVKRRSIEMERVERDAKKGNGVRSSAKNASPKKEDPLAAKYAEIKSDFEQLQLSQDAVIKAYQTGSRIDYAQIVKSALEMNHSAARLNSNLFPAVDRKTESEKEEKSETEPKTAKSMRDLIVELDNTIGSFAASSMFQNLRVVDPDVSAKAKTDLEKIIELSRLLKAEAAKLNAAGK